jgi:hypothetical protein
MVTRVFPGRGLRLPMPFGPSTLDHCPTLIMVLITDLRRRGRS